MMVQASWPGDPEQPKPRGKMVPSQVKYFIDVRTKRIGQDYTLEKRKEALREIIDTCQVYLHQLEGRSSRVSRKQGE